MQLSALTSPETTMPPGAAAIEVTGITADSRRVRPGFLFAALAGSKVDGARFVADAARAGAAAILAGEAAALPSDTGVPVLRAPEPRRALALMAARFYGRQPEVAVAVTGTNGKTSVAEFTRQVFAHLGRRAASLGTLGLVRPDGSVYGSLTTPDPVSLHESLATLAGEGITHIAFEASSHGLDQFRLDGVRLTAGAFTNLGRDHLDYHPDIEAYLTAKLGLFERLLAPGQAAVVNTDGARAADVMAAARRRGLRLLTVGATGETLRLAAVTRTGFAQRLSIAHPGGTAEVDLPLVGTYQASNALVAAGLAIAAGEPAEAAVAAITAIRGVAGRVEIIGEARGGIAVVDYAHKPEALAAVLDALRPFVTGRLVCVVGCGGDRDRGKRPIMGRIATERCEAVIITDDNPRSEVPAAIRAEVLAGVSAEARARVKEIGDRAQAIHAAIGGIGPGDVVVVAGKGHESGQIVGDKVLPFLDRCVVEAALEEARGHG